MVSALSRRQSATVEALTALDMVEHRMGIYLRGLAEREDARIDGSAFYGSIVADCAKDLAAAKEAVEALAEQGEG